MENRIAQALTKLFDRHRIVFWYDAKQDIFAGSYFQALEQQWFEVSFVRQ